MSLDRFIEAQNAADAGFKVALAELQRGRKSSHWIWYIFPQLAGLGRSPIAIHYGIRDLVEAGAYLRHAELRERLLAVMTLVADQLARGVSLDTLMGGRTDSLKLVSSATLFAHAAARLSAQEDLSPSMKTIRAECERVLQAARAEGFPPCAATLRMTDES